MHMARFDDDNSPRNPRLCLPLMSWSKSGSYHVLNPKIVLDYGDNIGIGTKPLCSHARNNAVPRHCWDQVTKTCHCWVHAWMNCKSHLPLLKYTSSRATPDASCRWHTDIHTFSNEFQERAEHPFGALRANGQRIRQAADTCHAQNMSVTRPSVGYAACGAKGRDQLR